MKCTNTEEMDMTNGQQRVQKNFPKHLKWIPRCQCPSVSGHTFRHCWSQSGLNERWLRTTPQMIRKWEWNFSKMPIDKHQSLSFGQMRQNWSFLASHIGCKLQTHANKMNETAVLFEIHYIVILTSRLLWVTNPTSQRAFLSAHQSSATLAKCVSSGVKKGHDQNNSDMRIFLMKKS